MSFVGLLQWTQTVCLKNTLLVFKWTRNVLVEEWKTNLMSLVILFHLLSAQHVSDINISIIRSLRLCCWITTSVVFFLGLLCVGDLVPLDLSSARVAGLSLFFSLQHGTWQEEQHPEIYRASFIQQLAQKCIKNKNIYIYIYIYSDMALLIFVNCSSKRTVLFIQATYV